MSKPQMPPDLLFIEAPSTSKKKETDKAKSDDNIEKPKPKKSITKTAEKLQKNRLKQVEQLLEKTNLNDDQKLDETLKEIEKIDEVCAALKCKIKVKDFSITCDYCKNRYCTQHYLPEVHGCGEEVRKDYRKKFQHPTMEPVPQKQKDKNAIKFQKKLKELEASRKKTMPSSNQKGQKKK